MTTIGNPEANFLSLPPEIRTAILEYVFEHNLQANGLIEDSAGARIVDHEYTVANKLAPLLVCRQFLLDGNLLALRSTHFLVKNLYISIPERLTRLQPKQLSALRSIAFTADSRHLREMRSWGQHAFACSALNLDTLTIILHQPSQHYLFDSTLDITRLLRNLQGVRRIVFVRNHAHVKGAFKTWYNRLVGLMLKTDHHERYDVHPANMEQTWWTWTFDDTSETFCLEACPSKPLVEEEVYMQQIKPLMEQLMLSIESEEWNPDPRSRNGT